MSHHGPVLILETGTGDIRPLPLEAEFALVAEADGNRTRR